MDSIDFQKALTHISTTISINIILWMIFIFWAWKWKVFYPWLVQTPDLSGKWKGKIISNFDKDNSKPISTEIDIKQDFFNIILKIKTDESLDKPGKLTHLRRMKLTRVNELPRFDLSLG
ncbi:hypothetical protein [Flagellimonas oceani]|uniref:hypothetical protein n=1 Tax=Flagellimonas oceani TaxID=2698672 RepID=UPI001F0F2767|nr:hypothetical protein [Allomuricauda oceani]